MLCLKCTCLMSDQLYTSVMHSCSYYLSSDWTQRSQKTGTKSFPVPSRRWLKGIRGWKYSVAAANDCFCVSNCFHSGVKGVCFISVVFCNCHCHRCLPVQRAAWEGGTNLSLAPSVNVEAVSPHSGVWTPHLGERAKDTLQLTRYVWLWVTLQCLMFNWNL